MKSHQPTLERIELQSFAKIGDTIHLNSTYQLEIPGHAGVKSVTRHTISVKIVKIEKDKVHTEQTSTKETWLEKDGVRLYVLQPAM